jgi:CRISPR-associated protein Cmr2
MNDLAFWQQKIIQFFHDPPAKPFAGNRKVGKHTKIAKELFEVFQTFNQGQKLRYWYKSADWAAAGADRPMLYVPKKKNVLPLGTVTWPKDPQINHPLSPGYRLLVPVTDDLPEREDAFESDSGEPRDPIDEELKIARELSSLPASWNDARELKKAYFALWRCFRDDLVERHRGKGEAQLGDPLWEEMPADTRCPDHSIWDHLKVTTALAFMKPHKSKEEPRDEGAREPWMLRFALGPTQEFIAQSRTSRDLWVSSFLLADLAWHAMQPFVEQYGPDCIVYPDLRGNPRADCWLFKEYRSSLQEGANPSTFAAVLPGAFVALLPRGGDGHLKTIEVLAKDAAKCVSDRWNESAEVVRDWFKTLKGSDWDPYCNQIWERQHGNQPIHCTWVALPWLSMGLIKNSMNLRGRALPAQRQDFRQPAEADKAEAEADRQIIEARRQRLAPWVPIEVWGHYEQAREVFARSRLDLHQMERGFDYALTHHQLGARHALRKATDPATASAEEPGEKCTLCGQREALRSDGPGSRLDNIRALARTFWKHPELDPDETGSERLCAICAMKRFLVKADQGNERIGPFNQLWAGMDTPFADIADRDDKIRVPFPSTATIAAQEFIEAVAKEGRLDKEIGEVVAACREADLPRTSFPRALPRLAALYRDRNSVIQAFLEYDAEDVVFPETCAGKKQALEDPGKEAPRLDKLDRLYKAVKALRDAVKDPKKDIKPNAPDSRIAVVRLDGDHMGRLLLGDSQAIGTRWCDVLNPKALERLKRNKHLLDAGWGDLLDSKRLMGPSLHAFVSRALGSFSHRLVPWVVEREFSGRLIYSGGDDVLCIVPAAEALNLAARLQQLFSAAWVVDADPPQSRDQWEWRRKGWEGDYDQAKARERFIIPIPERDGQGGTKSIELAKEGQLVEVHAAEDASEPKRMSVQGALLPMLGTQASLSAGIAIGHYKTPLSALLHRSKMLLELAKEPFQDEGSGDRTWTGRRAVAIGHASRGGEKTRFVLPWNDDSSTSRPQAQLTLGKVMQGFSDGTLPGRLPYKLREMALSARCGLDRIHEGAGSTEEKIQARKRLLKGLFDSCMEKSGTDTAQAALRIWVQGIDLERKDESHYTDGLLLCRELAQAGATGEGEE